MTQDQLINKFKDTFSHISGLEVLGVVNILGEEVLYLIHPLIFDGRKLPTAFHGYPVRSGFSDEEFPEEFFDASIEEYVFTPFRFEKFVDNSLEKLKGQLSANSKEEVLDAICFGNFSDFKNSFEAFNN